MPKKHAILIANTEYRDGKLAALAHPGLAYAELAEALKDPARGAFSQVETLVNANLSQVLTSLDRFFSRKPAEDILLVYVGAHGFLDSQGELFLALKESDRSRLKSTALMAAVLGMNLDQCPSPHKLLILDCRFHSPYPEARSGPTGPRIDPAKIFAGRGLPKRILLAAETHGAPASKVSPPAATSATQKLQIVAPKDFTRALAETLRTPSGAGGRAPFTVEDWWNDAAAELRASKAEPPQRLVVGEPPLTVLRGSSRLATVAMASPGGESVVTMPILHSEPEADWSRLSGIFPLEMFAPDLAPGRPAADEEAPSDPEPPRADPTLLAGPRFSEGADLVLRARQEIESATPADLSDPDAGTLESPLSTSPTLELPENPDLGDSLPSDSLIGTADGADSDSSLSREEGPARRPDATLFFDLRLPPDLSGNATLMWDRPGDDAAPAVTPPAPDPSPPLPRPPTTLGPRDTFTGLRARLKAQEEEEAQALLKAEKEESAQREKLEQWKARWESRHGSVSAGAADRPEAMPDSAPPAAIPGKPKDYQARMAALQKTLFVPGPDMDPGATAPPHSLPDPAPKAGQPGVPAAPPLEDGRATLMVSKDQFLNTGSHKVPTELAPGATIMVSKEEFYGSGTSSGPAARDAAAPEAEPRPARPIRAGGDAGRARRTGRSPGTPGRSPGRRKALLWTLAALAPVGLGMFLFFGAKSGMLRAIGIPGDGPGQGAEASRTFQATPRPAPPEAVPAETAPAEGNGDLLPQAAAVPAPESPSGQAAPVPPAPVAPAASAPAASAPAASAPAASAPAASAPAASAPAAPLRAQPNRPPAASEAAPAALPPAVPGFPAKPERLAVRPRPADPARIARLQADSLRRAEANALREARRAEKAALDAERQAHHRHRADSLKAARFTRDSLAIFLALARKDSLKAARAARAEAEGARLALARVKTDSLNALKNAAASEAQLRRSVNQAFKADTDGLRGLYNRFALGYPGLKGEVVVSLLVAPNGEIERGVIQSSNTGVKMFDQLVLGNILEWKIRPFRSSEAKAVVVAVNFPIE